MKKINFENKPSTNSPINATNLNMLQDNVEDDIGSLSSLNTTDKSNLVNAINEVRAYAKARVLWENQNESSEFAPQTVELNSSDYDILEIFFSYNPTSSIAVDGYQSLRIPKGTFSGALQRAVVAEGDYFQIQSRTISRIDDTHYSFGNARTYISSSGTYSTYNSRVIPSKIIGYKYNS